MAALFSLRLQTAEPCIHFHDFAFAQPVKHGVLHFVSIFFIMDVEFMNIFLTVLVWCDAHSDLFAWPQYFPAV